MITLIVKGFRSLFQVGFRATWCKVKGKLFPPRRRKTPLYTKKELARQRQVQFHRPLCFSILTAEAISMSPPNNNCFFIWM